MEGWTDRLHTGFLGEHVLVTELRLTSSGTFWLAAFVTFVICAVERAISLALSKRWAPFHESPGRRGRIQVALWRTALHWIATFLQILYMLIAMSFHVGLIMVVVTTLAAGQFVLELVDGPRMVRSPDHYQLDLSPMEPLLSSEPSTAHDKSPMRRNKPRSKPSDIFVHPAQSNLARADAAAVELGLHGSTERVSAQPEPESKRWQGGKGRDVAREILGLSRSGNGSRHRSSSQEQLFLVDSDSDDN